MVVWIQTVQWIKKQKVIILKETSKKERKFWLITAYGMTDNIGEIWRWNITFSRIEILGMQFFAMGTYLFKNGFIIEEIIKIQFLYIF